MRFELSVSDGEYTTGRVEPTIKGAKKIILSLAYAKVRQIYGDPIPHKVIKRIACEKELMDESFFYDQLLIQREMLRLSGLKRGEFLYCGYTSNSFIAYLIGLSEINPIEGDLTLPAEVMFGISKRRRPQFEVKVPASKISNVREALDNVPGVGDTIRAGSEWGIHPCMTLLIPDGYGEASDWFEIRADERGTEYAFVDAPYAGDVVLGINLIMDEYLDVLAYCEGETGVPVCLIPLSDEDTLLGIVDVDSYTLWDDVFKITPEYVARTDRVMRSCTPETFTDLVRLVGLIFSWKEVYEDTMNRIEYGTDRLSDAITSLEDCLDKLTEFGIERNRALYYADKIRWGKMEDVAEGLMCCGVPADFMCRCEKIRYASYRGHMMQQALRFYRLAYYMVHFPNVYMTAVKRFMSDPPEE